MLRGAGGIPCFASQHGAGTVTAMGLMPMPVLCAGSGLQHAEGWRLCPQEPAALRGEACVLCPEPETQQVARAVGVAPKPSCVSCPRLPVLPLRGFSAAEQSCHHCPSIGAGGGQLRFVSGQELPGEDQQGRERSPNRSLRRLPPRARGVGLGAQGREGACVGNTEHGVLSARQAVCGCCERGPRACRLCSWACLAPSSGVRLLGSAAWSWGMEGPHDGGWATP